MPTATTTAVTIAGVEVQLECGGDGPPLVFLPGSDGHPGWLQYHEALAAHARVYVPTHPGCGVTPLPEWIATINDLAVFYLWMLDALQLPKVHLVGYDVGGWLAAEMATMCPQVVERLVLIDAAGLRPQRSDITDIFLLSPAEVRAATFHDPKQVPEWQRLYGHAPSPEAMDRAEAALETMVRLCWKPYMHNPRLPFLLGRIHCPTLILWGREDAIIPLECGELYRQGIAGAQLHVLENCGHCPPLEAPQACADRIHAFLGTTR